VYAPTTTYTTTTNTITTSTTTANTLTRQRFNIILCIGGGWVVYEVGVRREERRRCARAVESIAERRRSSIL